MCEPTTLTMLSIGSTLLGAYQQQQQANAQEAAYQANYASEVSAQQDQSKQVDAQAADQMTARARDAMIAQSRINAAAADSGIAGISVDAQKQADAMAAGTDMATIEANREASQRQIRRQTTAAGNTLSTREASISRPSVAGVGLQIAGDYAKYHPVKTKTT